MLMGLTTRHGRQKMIIRLYIVCQFLIIPTLTDQSDRLALSVIRTICSDLKQSLISWTHSRPGVDYYTNYFGGGQRHESLVYHISDGIFGKPGK